VKIVVVGLGGIGTCLLPPLLRYLNYKLPGTGLLLVDGDSYTEENQGRQDFNSLGNKAAVKADELTGQFPELLIGAHNEFVTNENVVSIIREEDIVFACVDNHATRKLLSDRCQELNHCVLISGGNELTTGSMHIYIRCEGQDKTLPLTNEFHPEIQFPDDVNPGEVSCEEIAPSQPQLIFTNNLVAAWMLAAYYAVVTGQLQYNDHYCDLVTGKARSVDRLPQPC